MDVLKQERELGYKQTADKIRQILSKVRETPSHSYKRWVWELMQNAKDVKDPAFGSVSIKIQISEDQLSFSHNGLPFKARHLLGIVKQVSTKSSASEDEEVTGKFGTGFIVTHLLSDTIDIQGYIQDDNNNDYYRLSNLRLDRSGHSSEELIPKIEEANEYILKVASDRGLFPLVENYRQTKTRHSFDTVFTYNLNSSRKKDAAREGVADLKNTLPVTLVSVEEVKEVFIISEVDGKNTHFQMELVKDEAQVKWVAVREKQSTARNFIKFLQDGFCLIAEVNNFERFSLIERPYDQPVLYRNFPLIGSEQFHFPFILNGYEFYPTENRDDIVLVNEESSEVLFNRSVLERATKGVVAFTQYLIDRNAQNRHLCAFSRIPKLTVQLEDGVRNWLEGLQTSWRSELIDFKLVATENGSYISLCNCKIPNHGNSHEHKIRFHVICSAFLGANNVPGAEVNLSWIAKTGPKEELETWGIDLWYNLDQLLADVADLGSIHALSEKLENPISWLNSLYAFIYEVKETECYDEFAIVPNHQGVFNLVNSLKLEDPTSRIPESFLDILESIGQDWRIALIHREVQLVGKTADSVGLGDASKTINEFLQTRIQGTSNLAIKKNPAALSILVSIVRQVDNPQTKDFRSKVFYMAKRLFGFEDELNPVSDVRDFQFTSTLKLLIEFMHDEIESCKTLTVLAEKLELNELTMVKWLDEYYHLLIEKEDFKAMMEYGNIVPNRVGELSAYEDLFAFGTKDVPLDEELLDILKVLDEKQNWRKELLCNGITIHRPAKKFEELGAAIDFALREHEKEEAVNPGSLDGYKQVIYKLIDWCKKHPLHTENYLKHTGARSNDLWVKFSMTPEIMDVLRNENSLKLLMEISQAKLNLDEVRILTENATELLSLAKILENVDGGMQLLKSYAEEIKKVDEDFKFKKEIGEQVERAFKGALEKAGLSSTILTVDHNGIGSHDFEITNISNGKKFYLELKSYRPSSQELHLAPSQGEFGSYNPYNYALVTLERPNSISNVTNEYIKSNVLAKTEIKSLVEKGLLDYQRYNDISRDQNLYLVLREAIRLKIQLSEFKSQGFHFNELIDKIKSHIQ